MNYEKENKLLYDLLELLTGNDSIMQAYQDMMLDCPGGIKFELKDCQGDDCFKCLKHQIKEAIK